MQIAKGIQIIDLGLFIEKEKALIISDTHIGYESELNDKGFMMPRIHFAAMMKMLEKIVSLCKPEIIIINGDVKHNFGKIDTLEWKNAFRLIDFLKDRSKQLYLIKGNHDKVLEAIADKKGLPVQQSLVLGNILIAHGDVLIEPAKEVKTIIIGHEHPAITVKEGARQEKFKCFLLGKYKKKQLIVIPSFNQITEGTDITEGEYLSPYLNKSKVKDFRVFIVADKPYDFGRVKDFLQ